MENRKYRLVLTVNCLTPSFSSKTGQNPRSLFCSNNDTVFTADVPMLISGSIFRSQELDFLAGIGMLFRLNSMVPWQENHKNRINRIHNCVDGLCFALTLSRSRQLQYNHFLYFHPSVLNCEHLHSHPPNM